MSIESQLREQLTASIRAKDLTTANVIRMIVSKVTEKRTSKGFKGEVDDALHLDVIAAYRKLLIKAKSEFAKAGERGAEQITELEFEISFCSKFLPSALSAGEVRAAVKEAIKDLGADSLKMSGRVMGAVMNKHKGRVEAPLVKSIVAEELG